MPRQLAWRREHDVDELDALVAHSAAAAIDAQPERLTRGGNKSAWPDERSWGRELCKQLALRGVSAEPGLDAEQLATPSGDWNPAPGKVDVHPRTAGGPPGSLFVAELKLENINECVWDAFKLLWVSEALRTGPAYVACAAHEPHWTDPSFGGELFPVAGSRTTSSRDLIDGCRDKWCWQWRHDTAKPLRVPAEVETVMVLCGHRPQHFAHLELRILRIASYSTTKVDLIDGVPDGLDGCSGIS
jgi:hypothetical protein